jgi:hypothetical protein
MHRRHAASAALAASALFAAFVACTSDNAATTTPPPTGVDAASPASTVDASGSGPGDGSTDASSLCPPLTNDTPKGLDCTGLYANLATKQLADDVREFTPAVPLWSDGAEKTRWIYLPPGTTIDATDAKEWKFPVGTKLWKEFKVAGRRIETRLFQKLGPDFWVHASYQWAADELTATRVDGADFLANDAPYHIPTPSECDKCHNGRRDRVLGFDAVSLGLPEAVGFTLDTLAKEGRLSPTPATTSYKIGDGSSSASRALAWLNVNCGVTCHNENTTAAAYPTGLRFRLDPALLDGRTPDMTWAPLQTSIGITAITPRWQPSKRIVAGYPDKSLVVRLISERGDEQMPPLATFVVDQQHVQIVSDWIASLPPDDAGIPDDAGDPDGGFRDGGRRRDGGDPDGGTDDAGTDDGGTDDGGDGGDGG